MSTSALADKSRPQEFRSQESLSAMTNGRTNPSSSAWFWWKEIRQLAPLVVLLVIVACLIFLLNTAMDLASGSIGIPFPSEVVLLVFPGLFATGAGPLMVGQERSLRTLDWLSLLPIPAKRIIRTKFFVALVGLAIMWIFAALTIAVLGLGNQSSWVQVTRSGGYSSNPFSYPVWMAHSLFVLLVGFFVSWRIKNQFYSLIALIPLAFAPMVMTAITAEVRGQRMMSTTMDWSNFLWTLVGIAVFVPMAYRAGARTLGADAAPKARPLFDLPNRVQRESTPPRFGTQFAPIVWQSIHSAKGMLLVLTCMLVVAFVGLMFLETNDSPRHRWVSVATLSLVAAPLAVCWLGTSVFKHDGATERVRFLGERGVSVAKTYVALHIVPISILCTALLVYGVFQTQVQHVGRGDDASGPFITLWLLCLWAGCLYSVSQWVSQLFRAMILAVIVAPIAALIATVWLSSSVTMLGVPQSIVIVLALLPLFATALMMRRYMDGCDRPTSFWLGGVVGLLILLVPVGYGAWYVAQTPRMAAKQRKELYAESQKLAFESSATEQIYLETEPFRSYEDEWGLTEPIEKIQNSIREGKLDPTRTIAVLSRDGQLAASERISIRSWGSETWYAGFRTARMAWRQSDDEVTWEQFRPWLIASAKVLPRVRASDSIAIQETADRLEVLMIDTLDDDNLQKHREDEAVAAAIASLGTPESRAIARRRAALINWYEECNPEPDKPYSSLSARLESEPIALIPWLEPRLRETVLLAMLSGIEHAKNGTDSESWRRQMHDWFQHDGVFETSIFGDEMRSLPAIKSMGDVNPWNFGSLWGRDWEYVDAQSLAGGSQ